MKKLLSLLLVLFVFVISNTISAQAASTTTERLQGADRFEVAVNISKKGWPTGATTVVLVNYNAYADALAATPLAYQANAPILLTHPTSLTYTTKVELQRLKPQNVVIVGGEGSVSSSVFSSVKSLGIPNVTRVSGADRYEVAYNIAKHLPASDKIVMAYGLNFPDALAIAPYAARNGYPILLTNTAAMPLKTQQALSYRNPKGSIVVGGEASVSSTVYNKLPSPIRIGGKDRYEVATNIVRTLNLNTSKSIVATGTTFADALTGSVLGAKLNAPILLTSPASLPQVTKTLVSDKNITDFLILGGLASVSQNVVNQLAGPLAGLKLVVDAGHGGKDPGASGNSVIEKEVTLDVAQRLEAKLENNGATVLMTRDSDVYPTLSDRVNFANSQHADSFVSVHVNTSSSSSASGTETYWNSLYFGAQSEALAYSIQNQLYQNIGTVNRGVKQADFYVIKNTQMPSVLVELAFLSNLSDAKKLADPVYRDRAAQGILQGILNYYN